MNSGSTTVDSTSDSTFDSSMDTKLIHNIIQHIFNSNDTKAFVDLMNILDSFNTISSLKLNIPDSFLLSLTEVTLPVRKQIVRILGDLGTELTIHQIRLFIPDTKHVYYRVYCQSSRGYNYNHNLGLFSSLTKAQEQIPLNGYSTDDKGWIWHYKIVEISVLELTDELLSILDKNIDIGPYSNFI